MTCTCGSGYDRDPDICAIPRVDAGNVDDWSCPNCGVDGDVGPCATCADYGAHDGPCDHRKDGLMNVLICNPDGSTTDVTVARDAGPDDVVAAVSADLRARFPASRASVDLDSDLDGRFAIDSRAKDVRYGTFHVGAVVDVADRS